MRIAIHHRENSFSERWIEYCKNKNIDYVVVNCYGNRIIEVLKKEKITHLMWHVNHSFSKDLMVFPYVLNSADSMGIKTYPNFNTRWHFDDKIAQKYFLESIEAPLVKSNAFYDKKEALAYIQSNNMPVVAKLKRGAGSTNVKLIREKNQGIDYVEKMFSTGISSNAQVLEGLDQKLRIAKKIKNPVNLIKKFIGYIKKTKTEQKLSLVEKGYVYFQEFLPKNEYDTRVIVIKNRAFGVRRFNRQNDFRASGSGKVDYDYHNIDLVFVKEAFKISDDLKTQAVAFDFIYGQDGNARIIEICFGFNVKFYDPCPGYWKRDLSFVEGKFNPQYYMVDNFLYDE